MEVLGVPMLPFFPFLHPFLESRSKRMKPGSPDRYAKILLHLGGFCWGEFRHTWKIQVLGNQVGSRLGHHLVRDENWNFMSDFSNH